MKITLDLEKEFVEIAKREIEDIFHKAVRKAYSEADDKMDEISKKIVLMVKEELKRIKTKTK